MARPARSSRASAEGATTANRSGEARLTSPRPRPPNTPVLLHLRLRDEVDTPEPLRGQTITLNQRADTTRLDAKPLRRGPDGQESWRANSDAGARPGRLGMRTSCGLRLDHHPSPASQLEAMQADSWYLQTSCLLRHAVWSMLNFQGSTGWLLHLTLLHKYNAFRAILVPLNRWPTR